MTTHTLIAPSPTQNRPNRNLLLALAGLVLSIGYVALGTFADQSNGSKDDHGSVGDFFGAAGIAVVGAVIVFVFVVRTAARGNASRRGIVLAVLAVVSLVVFWSGLPAVLAAGAVACALAKPSTGPAARNAIYGLAAVAVVGGLILSLIG